MRRYCYSQSQSQYLQQYEVFEGSHETSFTLRNSDNSSDSIMLWTVWNSTFSTSSWSPEKILHMSGFEPRCAELLYATIRSILAMIRPKIPFSPLSVNRIYVWCLSQRHRDRLRKNGEKYKLQRCANYFLPTIICGHSNSITKFVICLQAYPNSEFNVFIMKPIAEALNP